VPVLHRLSWVLLLAAFTALCIAWASLTLARHPQRGALLTSLGMTGMMVLPGHALAQSPSLALAVLLGALMILHTIWRGVQQPERRRLAWQSIPAASARGASLAALGFWGLIWCMDLGDNAWVGLWSLACAFGIAGLFGIRWLVREGGRHAIRVGVLLGAALVVALGLIRTWGLWWECLTIAALLPATMAVCLPVRQRPGMEHLDWWEPILGHPERLLVATFLVLCLAGSVTLALPACSTTGIGIALVNAAFTAVSAVCVTGLVVLDTPVDFSLAGQVTILVLIQLGGLGIMTFSTVAMRLLGRRMSLRHEGAVAGLVSPQDRSQLFNATRRLIVFTFTTEALGAVCLLVAFIGQGEALLPAVWQAVFTAVSAFCNAGFALHSDNLMSYQSHPWVLHVVAALIITGGLSPLVVLSIPALLRRTGRPVAAQIQLALSMTLLLLVAGWIFLLAVEWSNTLGGLPWWHRVHNAWFQSVTLRTAGFNTVDIAAVRPATLTLMIVWMFIGGSPGGTAGGIKTTTVATLVLAVVAAVRGRWTVTCFRRRLSHRTVYKATAIATVGAVIVLMSLLVMQLTQAMPTDMALFEVVSALGTVGLSIGGTSRLDEVGKILIMACMFMGRVGPLTLFMFLSHRMQQTVWERPEEEIEVG
jgi:trk system potassium uptake protein TrkH